MTRKNGVELVVVRSSFELLHHADVQVDPGNPGLSCKSKGKNNSKFKVVNEDHLKVKYLQRTYAKYFSFFHISHTRIRHCVLVEISPPTAPMPGGSKNQIAWQSQVERSPSGSRRQQFRKLSQETCVISGWMPISTFWGAVRQTSHVKHDQTRQPDFFQDLGLPNIGLGWDEDGTRMWRVWDECGARAMGVCGVGMGLLGLLLGSYHTRLPGHVASMGSAFAFQSGQHNP